MRKVNTRDIAEESWTSPEGKFGGASKEIYVASGVAAVHGPERASSAFVGIMRLSARVSCRSLMKSESSEASQSLWSWVLTPAPPPPAPCDAFSEELLDASEY